MQDHVAYALRLAVWLGRAIGTRSWPFQQFPTEDFGIALPDAILQDAALTSALTQAETRAQQVDAATTALENAADGSNTVAILIALTSFGQALADLYAALKDVADALRNAITPATIPDAAARAAATALADQLPKLISDAIVASVISEETPRLAFLLTLGGLLDWRYVPVDPANPASTDYVRTTLALERIGDLIRDPEQHLRDTWHWGDAAFDPLPLFRLAAEYYPPEPSVEAGMDAGEPFLRIGSFRMQRDSTITPPGLRASFTADLDADAHARKSIGKWDFVVDSDARLTGSLGMQIAPPFDARLVPASGSASGSLKMFFERAAAARPFSLFGGAGLLAVTAKNLSAGLELKARAGLSNDATLESLLFADLEGLAVKLDLTQGADSFLQSFVTSGVEGEIDLRAEWRPSTGLRFSGGGSLETAVAVHKSLGPITLETLYLALKIFDDGTLALETTAALKMKIGPVTASADRVGAELDVRFDDAADAAYGALDYDLRFKPPSGLGVSIDAGPITGGGYLYFDHANGRYSGVLQLKMKEIAVTAIGILDTQLPGGQPGYSFLIILSAEFSPIQLGLGFTLNGVGGVAGLHRTIAIEPLRAGLRSKSLDDVLYPKDPIANAPRILGNLQRFFPVKKDHHLFGPTALIGWGTPTLLTIELGILVEFPPPILVVLLGQLECLLPKPESPVVQLHVDVLGVLDFGAKTFALDGTIYDSRIGPYALSGDFGLRLRWGDAPTFALSIGGFHPAFREIPPGLAGLRRITLALSGGNNPRLTLQCYLALTSNSLQFGARADLYAEAGRFNVSGWVGFDVLITYRPFGLQASLTAGFALRRGSKTIAGITVDATLTGPAPWHVWGDASMKILGFKVKVSFDATFGRAIAEPLPSTNIWTPLQAALVEPKHWSGVLPPAAAHVVTLGPPSFPYDVLIDPVTRMTVLERTAPLARTITRFAEGSPSGPRRFTLRDVLVDDRPVAGWSYVDESFAPAQFEQLSDHQKLSRPSFEKMHAGMSLPDAVTLGTIVPSDVGHATVIVDAALASRDGALYVPTLKMQEAEARIGSAALGGTRRAGTDRFLDPRKKPQVTMGAEEYVIVLASDLMPRPDVNVRGAKGAVLAALEEHLATHPADRGRLVAISVLDLEAA